MACDSRGAHEAVSRPDTPRRTPTAGRSPVTRPVFRLLLALEEEKAVRLQYGFTLLWFTLEWTTGQPGVCGDLVEQCARGALACLRGTDVVARFAPDALGILLVDADTFAIPGIVARVIEGWRNAGPLLRANLVWNAGAMSFPGDGHRGDEFIRHAEGLSARARAEGGNRLVRV